MLYNVTFSLLDVKCTPHKHSMLNFPFNQRAYIRTCMNFVPVFSRFSFFVVVDDVRQRSSQFAFFSINILSSGISSQKCNTKHDYSNPTAYIFPLALPQVPGTPVAQHSCFENVSISTHWRDKKQPAYRYQKELSTTFSRGSLTVTGTGSISKRLNTS